MKKVLLVVMLFVVCISAQAKGFDNCSSNDLLKLAVIENIIIKGGAHTEGNKIVTDKDLFYVADSFKFWNSEKEIKKIDKGSEIRSCSNFYFSEEEIKQQVDMKKSIFDRTLKFIEFAVILLTLFFIVLIVLKRNSK